MEKRRVTFYDDPSDLSAPAREQHRYWYSLNYADRMAYAGQIRVTNISVWAKAYPDRIRKVRQRHIEGYTTFGMP